MLFIQNDSMMGLHMHYFQSHCKHVNS